jgi:hypothetical protein
MGGLLHPVGPEPAQTYWARRGLVFGAGMVLAVAVVLIISGTTSGTAAQPSPPAGADRGAAIPTPSFLGPVASAQPTTSAITTSDPEASTKKTPRSEPVHCRAEELQPTLSAKQRVAPKQHTAFQLSLINGSDRTCIAVVTRKNFELKISFGSDRIWSTEDCPSMIKPISSRLRPDHAVAWSLTWNGKRSKPNCGSAHKAPGSGNYVATAQLAGAEPVKLRMILDRR